jgi:hypothetical protein
MNFICLTRLLKSLPFLTLIWLSPGCGLFETVESTKVPPSEIKQHYIVAATRDDTQVKVYFTQGGWTKSVDLDAPSKVEHNGAPLPEIMIFLGGPTYAAKFPRLETKHSFVYTNNDRQIFRNELSFQPLELPAGEIAISRGGETGIRLSRAVRHDETISIALESVQKPAEPAISNSAPGNNKLNERDYMISLNDELDESRSLIVLKPKNLKRFVNGKAVLTVTLGGSMPLQQATAAGGAMNWTYSSTRGATVGD